MNTQVSQTDQVFLSKLEHLFWERAKLRIQRHYPDAMGMSEKEFIDELMQLTPLLKDIPKRNNVPLALMFAIVFPHTELDKKIQLEKTSGGKAEIPLDAIISNLDSSLILTPYLITDIDLGDVSVPLMDNGRPKIQEDRFPLIDVEGLAIVMDDPSVLRTHRLDILGSRYQANGTSGIVSLYQHQNELFLTKVQIEAFPGNNYFPTCGQRLFP